MKRLIIISDVWKQVNGVTRTLKTTIEQIKKFGVETKVIHPGLFKNNKFPLYPEILWAYPSASKIEGIIREFNPDYLHIATEGSLGFLVRNLCVNNNLNFTTSYTTNIPEYGWEIWNIPKFIGYTYVRWFHKPAAKVMIARKSVRENLESHGFKNDFVMWSRGVDTNVFYPRKKKQYGIPKLLYVGRVSKEKNIDTFVRLTNYCKKTIVGNGPYLDELKAKCPEIEFTGYLHGDALAKAYSDADCLVFPSRTDTFGLVMLESLACGTPVATYEDYKDILPSIEGVASMCLATNRNYLRQAVSKVLANPKNQDECVRFVKHYYSWEKCSRQFLHNLVKMKG